jgi:membrane associated rhomboid family serine protease
MIKLIIFLNILVYALWFLLDVKFMYLNFLVSTTHLQAGYYWTLITSVFSHNMFLHLLINMFILHGFGSIILSVLKLRRFLSFYLFAGILGSLGHCFASTYFLGDPSLPALGASGAISGLLVLFSFLFPREKLLLFGLIPIPALIGALVFIGLDIFGLITQMKGSGLPIGHGAHLGGALFGILYFLKMKLDTKTIDNL